MSEQVILVNEQDQVLGTAPKLTAHERGQLHRAFSVFIFNSKNQLLLQQRAIEKYHSGGLWTNTCCGHPRPGETTMGAAQRRLREEMSLTTRLTKAFTFNYCTELSNGLIENEVDHVFIGTSDQTPRPAAAEVRDWRFTDPDRVTAELALHPQMFTDWFKICWPQVHQELKIQTKVVS